MKKIVVISLTLIIFAAIVTPVLAQTQLQTGLEYGTFTGLGTRDLREGVMTIVRLLFGFLGVIMIVGIVYGGFLVLVSAGNEEQTGAGRKIITAAIIGLAILFLAYAIAAFVIGQLLTATGAPGY